MKKLLDNRGETLVESLVSILIMSLIFVFLTGSVVVATRSLENVKASVVPCDESKLEADGDVEVVISDTSGHSVSVDADKKVIKDDKGVEAYAAYSYDIE